MYMEEFTNKTNLYKAKTFGTTQPKYTQADLNRLDLENYKGFWDKSLEYLGNVSAKPEDITIIGCRVFDSTNLLAVCDPGITPINYMLMGEYYRKLTEWIYEGNNPIDFRDPDSSTSRYI